MLKLHRSDIRVIKAILQGFATLRTISVELGMGRPQLSVVLKRLAARGFVNKMRNGASISVELSTQNFIEPLKRLLAQNLQHHRLLGGSALPLLTVLVMPSMAAHNGGQPVPGLPPKRIQAFSGLSRSTVHQTLKDLMKAGAVYRIGRDYGISGRMRRLGEFVRQYALYQGSMIVQRWVQTAVEDQHQKAPAQILKHFQAGGELIFTVPYEVELADDPHITPTSFTTFMSEDLEFRTPLKYYHYSMGGRQLQKEDAAIDHLLLDPRNVQNVAYSMLYLKALGDRVNWSYVMEMGRLFNIFDLLETMRRFLNRFPHVEPDPPGPVPSPEEFRDLCVLYGVRY